MGLLFHIDITDIGLPEETPELGLPIDYSRGFDAFAATFLSNARDLCPVDTGRLISSISAVPGDESITCSADCEYAQYVEFGTYKMYAQPYFIPALEIAAEDAFPIWMDAIEEAMEQEEELLEEMENEENGRGAARAANAAARAASSGRGMGGLAGGILGAIVVGIIIGFMQIFFDAISPGGSSGSSGGSVRLSKGDIAGAAGDFDPEEYVEIT